MSLENEFASREQHPPMQESFVEFNSPIQFCHLYSVLTIARCETFLRLAFLTKFLLAPFSNREMRLAQRGDHGAHGSPSKQLASVGRCIALSRSRNCPLLHVRIRVEHWHSSREVNEDFSERRQTKRGNGLLILYSSFPPPGGCHCSDHCNLLSRSRNNTFPVDRRQFLLE